MLGVLRRRERRAWYAASADPRRLLVFFSCGLRCMPLLQLYPTVQQDKLFVSVAISFPSGKGYRDRLKCATYSIPEHEKRNCMVKRAALRCYAKIHAGFAHKA
ncbi:unnamed protein product, partial [Scytosiphon promiscuus]